MDRWTVVETTRMVVIVLVIVLHHRWRVRDLHDIVVRKWVVRWMDLWTMVEAACVVVVAYERGRVGRAVLDRHPSSVRMLLMLLLLMMMLLISLRDCLQHGRRSCSSGPGTAAVGTHIH